LPAAHNRKSWRCCFNNFFLGCHVSKSSAILAVSSQAQRANRSEPGTLINYCSDDKLSLLSLTLKLEMINISIFGRSCSLIGFRIYQLSPKSAEKGQKSVMQKRHKRHMTTDLFTIPMTPIKIENHEDFVSTTFSRISHVSFKCAFSLWAKRMNH
jgi:hypothetical protein